MKKKDFLRAIEEYPDDMEIAMYIADWGDHIINFEIEKQEDVSVVLGYRNGQADIEVMDLIVIV